MKKNMCSTYAGFFNEVYAVVPTPIFAGHLGVKAYYSWGSDYKVGGLGVSFSLGKAGGAGISITKYHYRPALSAAFGFFATFINYIVGKVKNVKH